MTVSSLHARLARLEAQQQAKSGVDLVAVLRDAQAELEAVATMPPDELATLANDGDEPIQRRILAAGKLASIATGDDKNLWTQKLHTLESEEINAMEVDLASSPPGLSRSLLSNLIHAKRLIKAKIQTREQ